MNSTARSNFLLRTGVLGVIIVVGGLVLVSAIGSLNNHSAGAVVSVVTCPKISCESKQITGTGAANTQADAVTSAVLDCVQDSEVKKASCEDELVYESGECALSACVPNITNPASVTGSVCKITKCSGIESPDVLGNGELCDYYPNENGVLVKDPSSCVPSGPLIDPWTCTASDGKATGSGTCKPPTRPFG